MLKRHCDLCDSVIKSYQTPYRLVKTINCNSDTPKEIELEMCKACLDEIIKRKNERNEVEYE